MPDELLRQELPVIGWRERVSLPDLGLAGLKAKIDTGARSSVLHAIAIETCEQGSLTLVRFQVQPQQHHPAPVVATSAPLLDWREVRSSNGLSQQRPTIRTIVKLGDWQWPIELTLTNRDSMSFRLLLGREAIRQRFCVDAGRSYLQSDPLSAADAL